VQPTGVESLTSALRRPSLDRYRLFLLKPMGTPTDTISIQALIGTYEANLSNRISTYRSVIRAVRALRFAP
jgi:hypothetical protein